MDDRHKPPPLALELWSFRRELEENQQRTLDLIANAGFSEVEVAGFHNLPPKGLSELLAHRSLKVCSIHGPTLDFEIAPAEYVSWSLRQCQVFNTQRVVFAVDPRQFLNSNRERWLTLYMRHAQLFVQLSRELAKAEIEVGYHCYAHDYLEVNGKKLITHLLELERPPSSGLQLDTQWMRTSNVSPDWLKEIAGSNIHSVHVSRPLPSNPEKDANVSASAVKPYLSALAAHKVLNAPGRWILETFVSPDQRQHRTSVVAETIALWKAEWPRLWEACSFKPERLSEARE